MTTLDPRARHHGARVGVVASALGEPLIPWQTDAARLVNAIDPDNPRRWRYPLVVITVPRQSGKSTLLRAVNMDRLIKPVPTGRRPQPTTLWMTAQSGKDARRRFADLAERATASPALKPLVTLRRSVGTEALKLGNTALSPFAPTPSALHGETSPLVSVDEAWAFDEARAATLLAAITPVMQNVEGSQLIIISTAGTHESQWLWSLVKAGRASLTDPSSRMAYLEYSADPRFAEGGDGDPRDPAALNFHPAITGGITTADAITGLYDSAGSDAAIRRGFLNLWPADMEAASRDAADLEAARVTDPPKQTGPLVFAVDVANDRSGASIYAAHPTPAGHHVELVETGPGITWLPAAVDAIPTTAPVWADPTGYTGAALSRCTRTIHPAEATTLAASTALLLSELADHRVTITAPADLTTQYTTARTRPAGSGFLFDARRSPDPIDHLRAAALALWAATQTNPLPAITF